jgi:hypothetical protein
MSKLTTFSSLLLVVLLGSSVWNGVDSVEVVKRGLGEGLDSMPSTMPTENRAYIDEQYNKFMSDRRKQKEDKEKAARAEAKKREEEMKKNAPPKPTPGISPKSLGLTRDPAKAKVALTDQVTIPAGVFWFGSQMDIGGKVYPAKMSDGAKPRKRASVGSVFVCVCMCLYLILGPS